MSDKKKFKDTKVGGFLTEFAPNLAKTALSLGGGFLPDGGLLQKLADKIRTSDEIDAEQKMTALTFLTMDAQDRADARAMQVAIATSEHSTKLGKNFIYYLTTGVFLFSAAVVLLLFFQEIPEKNRDVINFILGVVVGTGLTGIFNYFFGSSKGSSDKMNHIINGKNN